MKYNLLLAFVLSFLTLFLWQFLVKPPVPPIFEVKTELNQVQNEASSSLQSKEESPYLQRAKNDSKDVVIDTKYSKITFHSYGAGIKSWVLKKAIPKNNEKLQGIIELIPLESQNGKILETFPDINFIHKEQVDGNKTSKIIFTGNLNQQISIVKTYTIFEDESKSLVENRWVSVSIQIQNNSDEVYEIPSFMIEWKHGLSTVQSELKENVSVTRVIGLLKTKKIKKMHKEQSYDMDQFSWIGLDNRYFLMAIEPDTNLASCSGIKNKTNKGTLKVWTKSLTIPSQSYKSVSFNIYLGPKQYDQLKQTGLNLNKSIDFGFFGFLGYAVLVMLNFFYGLIGNYGWAIILLTLVFQVFLFPLNIKSYASMAKMKIIQPEIQKIQKKYKDDKQTLNMELLKLYKTSKTNPFGGCIPMILQIPIFLAFFSTLRNSFELHGAGWIFWIRDLSQKDPYYILPIAMGVGMLIQQKFSSSVVSKDNPQAKVMMILPIIFTLMFLNFPSGLVLYWLTNSIVSIIVQAYCTKQK